MERKIERGWKSIVCPGEKEKVIVMCEWDILSETGRILKKTLKQIDCHNPKLSELGGTDCNWACKRGIATEGTIGLGMEWLWVCAIIVGGIIWIALYSIYIGPRLRLSGLSLLFGIPLLIGLILYYISKMMSLSSKAQM